MNKWEKDVERVKLNNEQLVIKKLEKHYENALKDINNNIRLLSSDTTMQSRMYQLSYQKVLRDQVEAILQNLRTKTYTTLTEYINEAYNTGFVGTTYSMAGQGVPMILPIDQNAVLKASQIDSKLSVPLYESLGNDMKELKNNITSEITRGIASGTDWKEIGTNIFYTSNIPLRRAQTIARTEGHRVQQQAANDARNEAVKKGCRVVKQWDSTLDGKTRSSHRELDGQIREVGEMFTVNGHEAEYPSAFGIPAEDINCRCVAMTRAVWGLDQAELDTLKERARFFGLDKNDSFAEYEEKYLKAAETVKEEEKTKFVPAKTIAEAEEFAKKFVDEKAGFGSLGVSYKGVHIDIANAINQEINRLYSMLDVNKIGGIAAPAKNTKLGQKINAHAAYSTIRRSLVLNRDNTKTLKGFTEGLLADARAYADYLKHPEHYNLERLGKRLANVLVNSKVSGRGVVPTTLEESIDHEFGHHIETMITKEQWKNIIERMGEYAKNVSGYATDDSSEYVAESFASYMKGENVIDPYLRGVFDGFRRK